MFHIPLRQTSFHFINRKSIFLAFQLAYFENFRPFPGRVRAVKIFVEITKIRTLIHNSLDLIERLNTVDMLLDELIEPFNTQELVVLLLKCTNDKGRPFLPLAIHKATRLAFSYSKISRIIEKVALQAIEQKRAVLTSRIPESDSQYVFEVDHLPETIEGVIAIPINDSKYIDVAGKSNQMGVLCIIINPPKKLKLSFVAANLNKDSIVLLTDAVGEITRHYNSEILIANSYDMSYNQSMLEELNYNTGSVEDEANQFAAKYNKNFEAMYGFYEDAHPVEPKTGEIGSFVRFVFRYPLYRTPSGREFFVHPDTPKPSKKP